jgi:hypothetical protein
MSDPVAGNASAFTEIGTGYEIDDLWNNAFSVLGGIAEAYPDTPRLVDLLRSDMPMPSSARKTLAELLSPGDPPIHNWKLVPERIKRIDPIATQLDGAAAFEKNRSAGMSKEAAAGQTGIRGGKQINRYRKLLERLGRRLHGETNREDIFRRF